MSDDEVVLWEDLEEKEMLAIPLVADEVLNLRQFVSADDRWGIHSSVWEGGLAILAFLLQKNGRYSGDRFDLVIDLGSGTGVAGLGLAKVNFGSKPKCLLTDIDDAIPLLEENIGRNHLGNRGSLIVAKPLLWGVELSSEIVCDIQGSKSTLILGADIVYRQTIMNPLIRTLLDLLTFPSMTCLLSIHSIRTHLPEFLCRCEENNLKTKMVAIVTLPDDKVSAISKSIIQQDSIMHNNDFNACDGRVCIFEISKRSCT